MDQDEIDRRALEVLATCPTHVWNPQSPPVPVEEIANTCFGLWVEDVEPEVMQAAPGAPPLEPGQSLSGLLIPGLGRIWVNAEEARQWPTRRRFTIAHELGHHVLHQNDSQQPLFCRHASVAEEEPSAERPPPPQIEEEANRFAAALLMPAVHVQHYYRETDGHFQTLCEIFNCSGGAMGRRLHQVI